MNWVKCFRDTVISIDITYVYATYVSLNKWDLVITHNMVLIKAYKVLIQHLCIYFNCTYRLVVWFWKKKPMNTWPVAPVKPPVCGFWPTTIVSIACHTNFHWFTLISVVLFFFFRFVDRCTVLNERKLEIHSLCTEQKSFLKSNFHCRRST